MLSFKQLFMYEGNHEIQHTENGDHYYSDRIGNNSIITHFLHQGENNYDVHFSHHNENKPKKDSMSRQGVSKISPEERIKSIRSVTGAVHHFIKNNKPSSITAYSNTKGKQDWAHHVMTRYGEKTGAKTVKVGTGTKISF